MNYFLLALRNFAKISRFTVVARGAAILAAASANGSSVVEVMQKLGCEGKLVLPDQSTRSFHEKKFEAFKLIGEMQRRIIDIMQ